MQQDRELRDLARAISLTSIFRLTGILPTENQALRPKGEAYRAYQARRSGILFACPSEPPERQHAAW
jgi:hypothetical protein